MANKLSNVSILTVGEAKGHNLLIDETSLQQALQVANSMKRIKVTMGHGAPVTGILGYIDGFRIEGDRLMGDLTLFNTNEAQFIQHLAQVLPEGFGMSLTFSGVPEEVNGNRFARVTEIYDCSIVSEPAANPAGMFSAFSAVDMKKLQMNEASAEVKKELSEPTVVPAAESEAPAAQPAPAVEALAATPSDDSKDKAKMAEPTLADIANMLTEVLRLMKIDIAGEQSQDAAAPQDPVEDLMKDVSYMRANVAPTTLEKAKADAAGAVAVPAESSQPLGRAEILNQFNAEKSPIRRSELLRKLGL
ncbi:MAG: hypothetical protein EBR82_38405 [Caulobacteraceae bacterium]|nr:hypothetical protein [Caulobacteraceae bacterium]